MSEEILQQFNSVAEKVSSKEISIKEAAEQIKNLDFNLLSLEEIKVVEDSDWIPDELYVKIIRSWMKNQEKNINQIISFLALSNAIGKDQMISFVESVFKPENTLSLEINNIIEKIATGGGNRQYINPVDLGLIKISTDEEMAVDSLKLRNLFSGDPNKRFQSQAKPKASFRVELPPYLKVIPTSYKLRAPATSKGPKTWSLQAKSEQEGWIDIATVKNCTDFNAKGVELTFPIEQKDNFAYSSFQFVNLEVTNDGNHSLSLSSFDISGIVILKSNRKY